MADIIEALFLFLNKTQNIKGNWFLGGSTALKILISQGEPGDIDVFTDYETGQALSEALVKESITPWQWAPHHKYANWRFQARLKGVPIEVYGELRIKQNLYDYRLVPEGLCWRERIVLDWQGFALNLLPLPEAILFSYLGGKESFKVWCSLAQERNYCWLKLRNYWEKRGVPARIIRDIRTKGATLERDG